MSNLAEPRAVAFMLLNYTPEESANIIKGAVAALAEECGRRPTAAWLRQLANAIEQLESRVIQGGKN